MARRSFHLVWLAIVASLVAVTPVHAQMHTQQQEFTCYKCVQNFVLTSCEDTQVNEMGYTGCDDGSGECQFSGMSCARLPDLGAVREAGVEVKLASGESVRALPVSPGLWITGDCETGLRTFAARAVLGSNMIVLDELDAAPVQVATAN